MLSLLSKVLLTVLTLLALLIVFGLSEESPFLGWPSFVLQMVYWGGLLSLIVIWRGRATAARPFGRVMRGLRGLVWVFHFLCCTAALAYCFGPNPFVHQVFVIVLAIPSALTLLFLYKTAKPKGDPTTAAAASTGGTGDSVESLRAFYQTYTTQHQAELDVFAQQFRALLIEKYGFREDFVRAESYTISVLPGVSAFAVWHHKGKTPEEAAKQIFNDMCFSPDVNNPAIFARHVDTGEDLPPDYDYKDWQHRYLGRTPVQKASFFIMLPVTLAFCYALVFLTYLPSDVWYYTALGMSIALVIAFGISIYNRWKSGRLLTQPGKRKLKAYDLIWMPPFAVFMIWFTLAGGVGGVITEMTGTPHTAVYIYKKSSGKPCLHVGDSALVLSKFCLRREVHNTLPKDGQARFSGKQSWFGVTLSRLDPAF